jgi:hypothetical protein
MISRMRVSVSPSVLLPPLTCMGTVCVVPRGLHGWASSAVGKAMRKSGKDDAGGDTCHSAEPDGMVKRLC